MNRKVLVVAVVAAYALLVFFMYLPSDYGPRIVDINGETFLRVCVPDKSVVCTVDVNGKTWTLVPVHRECFFLHAPDDVNVRVKCVEKAVTFQKARVCDENGDYGVFCTALVTGDDSLCWFSVTDWNAYRCVAYVRRDPLQCLAIPDSYWRDWCLLDAVRNGVGDEGLCGRIEDENFRKACEGTCEQVEDPVAREYCVGRGTE